MRACIRQRDDHIVFARLDSVAGQLPAKRSSALARLAAHKRGQCSQKMRIAVRHIFGLEAVGIVFSDKTGVEVTCHKLGMRQQR